MSIPLSSATQVEDDCRTASRPLSQTFVVPLLHGMHARPWVVLIKTLRQFRSRVEVEANGKRASGQSIIGLMALGAAYGAKVTFTISGEDAGQALGAVRHLFQNQFQGGEEAIKAATPATILCKQ